MQQHAMALGYFFLAVFCIFTSTTSRSVNFEIALLLAALLAVLAGLAFLLSACRKWLSHMVGLAQQGPVHQSRFTDVHTA